MKARTLFAIALLTAGCGDVESPAERLETVEHALATDPSFEHPYGACGVYREWEFVDLRIYYPIQSGNCSQAVYAPLVILLHGVTYSFSGYDTILRHLARNGMIAVSVDWQTGDTVARIRDVMDEYLFHEWDKAPFIDPTRVAVIGHSRGAEHAVALANDLAAGPDPGGPTWTVRAIAELAPVTHPAVDGSITTGYLLLHGSDDGDQVPANSFAHYEAAGPAGSQLDPTFNPNIVYKAMKLFEDGNHAGFTGSGAQAQVTKGYLMAFLAAHLLSNATWYEDYIRGDYVPYGWDSGDVWTQHRDGFLRRVIDRFDDGNLSPSSIGGTVTPSNVTTAVLDLGADASSPHTTHVLRMMATSASGYVEWTIPSPKRDVSAFEFLSFRLGQVSGTPADDVRVQIQNGATWSNEIVAAEHGPIAQPMEMCTTTGGLGSCMEWDVQDHMTTIRVPLAAFGVHDNVARVRLRFRGQSAQKYYYLDSLEFSEYPLKP